MYPVELYPGLDRVRFTFCIIDLERTVLWVAWKAFQHELDVLRWELDVEGIQGDCSADVSQEKRSKEGEGKQSKLNIIRRETTNKSH